MQKEPEKLQNSRLSMATIFITVGLLLVGMGLLWPYLQKLNLFHLPGDIVVKKENFRFYIPITTSIILSILLSLLFWFISRFR